jgi:exodeoxyribonuclease VII large subunit
MSAQFPLFAAEPVWSVAALTHFVRELFDSNPQLQDVSVEGEVSNLTRSTAGHLYFTLRDAQAALSCVVWRADAQQLARQPINGDQVVAFGSVSVYEQTGRYQLYATSVQLAGFGERLRQLEELKRRLAAEGLFDAGRKRALPAMPRHIALVTSPRGAAVSDMRRVLARRWPLALVSLLPAVVQGDSAPAEIVAALQAANRKHPDVILLARGGGAIEDLWAFNDERVVRAIVASAAPVVTGVGHETDVTLADFAADVRAATPSVAAELATPNQTDVRQQLDRSSARLSSLMRGALRDCTAALLDASRMLQALSPRAQLRATAARLQSLQLRLQRGVQSRLQLQRARLDRMQQLLLTLGPVPTLARGYAIVTHAGAVVRQAQAVPPPAQVHVRLAQGSFTAEVQEITAIGG